MTVARKRRPILQVRKGVSLKFIAVSVTKAGTETNTSGEDIIELFPLADEREAQLARRKIHPKDIWRIVRE